MSNSLTSHEDLTPYTQQLSRISQSINQEMDRQRSFASDSETLIKDLLTEVMSCRKLVKQASSIAYKFLEAYQTGNEENSKLLARNSAMCEDIGHLNAQIQKYEKEIEVKDNRYETISMEAIDMEQALKMLNNECSSLKKEREFLKNEMVKKEQTSVVRENTIQQRQKMIIEVEKDKEVDKVLKSKYESLLAENKKKQLEIDDLNNRLTEMENIASIERSNADKAKASLQQSRSDISIKKTELESLIGKNRNKKEKIKQLKLELYQQKSFNENLVSEYDRQRNNSIISVPREFVEIPEGFLNSRKSQESFVSNNKSESLGMYMEELEPQDTKTMDTPFFMVTSPSKDQGSPKFMLFQNKTICSGDKISIFADKMKLTLDSIRVFSHKIDINLEKLDDISIVREQTFEFDDTASLSASETEASSRVRKNSTIDSRDPIKEFFIFVSFM